VRLRSAPAVGKGCPAVLKNLLIDASDLIAGFCKRRAALWLRRSLWWADFADAVETGVSVEEIRKNRERDEQ
jgi:hypothetical protein